MSPLNRLSVWSFGTEERAPAFLKFRSSKGFITFTVASSVFTDIFTYSLVVPVFPFALTSRAGVDPNDIQQWTSVLLAVYAAALLATSPLFGWLSDRMGGRQGPFLMGLILLAGATLMLCLGKSIAVFAVGRVLQGASASVVWIVGLALIADTVGSDEVGGAMGYVGFAMSCALLLGPLLGGIVLESGGYYAVYAMAFALIGIDIAMRIIMIERSKAAKWLTEEDKVPCSPSMENDEKTGQDLPRIQSTMTDDSEGRTINSDPKTADQPASNNVLNRTASNAAEALSSSAPGPLKGILAKMPPVVLLLGSRRLLATLWATVIVSTSFTAYDAILPLYVKDLFKWDSTGAGLVFLPICIATFIGPLVGKLSDKYGPRWFATGGFILCCPAMILLRLVEYNSLRQKVLLCALLGLTGLGLDLALTPVMAEVSYAVVAKTARRPAGFYGKNGAYAQAYGLFNMAWAAGSIIGPLLGGFVNNSQGWGTTNLILGCVCVFTALPTVIWIGGSIFKTRRQQRNQEKGGQA